MMIAGIPLIDMDKVRALLGAETMVQLIEAYSDLGEILTPAPVAYLTIAIAERITDVGLGRGTDEDRVLGVYLMDSFAKHQWADEEIYVRDQALSLLRMLGRAGLRTEVEIPDDVPEPEPEKKEEKK